MARLRGWQPFPAKLLINMSVKWRNIRLSCGSTLSLGSLYNLSSQVRAVAILSVMLEPGIPTDPMHPLALSMTEDERRRVREHVEVLLTDPLFNNSKRLPAFIRYVVKEALEGDPTGQIKERTLGVVVFGRPADYDTNADPVVRMTAGEVRKKLAQYYYANHHADLQIEVPLGSYMPRFRFSQHAPAPAAPIAEPASVAISAPSRALALEAVVLPDPRESTTPSRRTVWVVGMVVALLVLSLAGIFVWRSTLRQTPVDKFWSSFTGSSKRVLIVLPALSRVPQALPLYHFEAESVAIEDAEVATGVSNELNARRFGSRLALATAVSLSDLRSNPFVLIGAMDNVWTMRLSQTLPFAFVRSDDRRYGRIVDRKDTNISWSEDFSVPNSQIPQDYGIIARFTDSTTEQPTVLIAGISAEGTQAAGEAVTTPRYLDMLLKAAGNPPNGFEAVIQTRVIGGESGPPQIVAMRTW